MSGEAGPPTLFGFPLNRIVAFVGPYVAAGSGAVATWLLVHVHFLATFHVTHDRVASAIAQAAVFGIVTLVTWLGHQKWLDGWQAWAYGKDVAGLPVGPLLDPPEGEYNPDEFGPTGEPKSGGTGKK